jgi:uncharacterized protein (TIGR04255 family)
MPAPAYPASPYDVEHVDEVPLRHAPLVRVLAQVRHPALRALSGEQAEFTALNVSARLSDAYPIFEVARESAIVVTSNGVTETNELATPIWRLRNPDENWQISFTKDFIAIETKAYAGRTEFCDRLREALLTYQEVVRPPSIIRVGVRYTNRLVADEHLSRLADLVRGELLGPAVAELPAGVNLAHSFGQAQYGLPDGGSLLNWGILPPNSTFDASIPPIPGRSWLLDIDCFSIARSAFDASVASDLARQLATRAYAHFRWSVTEGFIRAFKGD